MVRVVVRAGERELAGEVEPGESWADAAERLAPDAASRTVPLDLSGPDKVFAVDADVVVAVRPMTHGDLPDVVRWRSAPHVARWWADDGPVTRASMTAAYGARIDGEGATRMWVWEVNGRSIGMVQDYRIADHPEFALLAPDPAAIGVDYLVGDVDRVGRGLGTRCLWAWARHVHARHPEARALFAAPDHRNAGSLRVLAKVGFTEGLWFDEPRPDGRVDTVVGCTLDVPRVLSGPLGFLP